MKQPSHVEEGSPEPVIYDREAHTVSRSNLDEDALKIMYRLSRNGFKAYLVGGGVRDVLLGKRPKDFDIATDATPRQVKSLFRNCRIIGRRFKLAHVFFPGGKIIEVSTFRDASSSPELEDGEGDTRSGPIFRDNKFGTEATDALRRDITVNALFYDLSTFSIIDYVGGMEDLRAGIIRVIGDPDVRFEEDPVRLLRVVRHAARNNFTIEAGCLRSPKANKELLLLSSPVRVYEEFKKDLSSYAFLPILRLLQSTGLLNLLIPQLGVEDGALLQEGAHLPICLERVEELVHDDVIVPTHVLFALLLLHIPRTGETVFVDVFDRYRDGEEIAEHLKSTFAKLAVPRKERERIEILLTDWMHLSDTIAAGEPRVSSRCSGERRGDLELLYRLLQGADEDDATLQCFSEQVAKRNRPARSRPRNRRRRAGHGRASL